MQHVGKLIKKAIEDSGLKQKDVASRLNISVQHLHNLFAKENIDTKYLFDLSIILGKTIDIYLNDSIDFASVHERRLAKLRQIELQLKTGSDEEIIQQFNLKDEEIKKLKRKLHVIVSMIYQIKGFQDKLLKELDPGLSNALNRDKAYRVASEQLMKAIDAILNIDRDETKMDEYREFIYELAIEQGILPLITDNMESKKEDL